MSLAGEEIYGLILTWGVLAQWMIIGGLFFWDCLKIHYRTHKEYDRVKHLRELGRIPLGEAEEIRLIAKGRKDISFWFLAGSSTALILGCVSVYRSVAFPLPPDTAIIGTISRELIITMFFFFWRAKRSHVNLYRKIEDREKRERSNLRVIEGGQSS